MSCVIQLTNVGGDNTGLWYVTSGPTFPINLGVSENPAGPFTYGNYAQNDQVGSDNSFYIDYSNMAAPASYPATYVFTYVVGGGGPGSCGGGCTGCATFTLTILPPPISLSPLTFCTTDNTPKNLFDLVGFGCVLPNGYILTYEAGSPQDPDFDMDQNNCVAGTYGDFIPSQITPDTYYFRFTRKNADFDCDGCSTILEVTIVEPPCIGSTQTAFMCASEFDCP